MSLAFKRQEILKQIRKNNREQIRKTIREAIITKANSTERPLMSNVLADFIECTHWDLCQESQRLSEFIETICLTQLEDDQHEEFITDLYYLIHENIITMPFGARFKRNQSGYTATLVALTANYINQNELTYWIEYMDEEAKDAMFYAITVQDDTHERWITNPQLYAFLLKNIQWMESAATTFKDFLVLSEAITKKQIDQCLPFVESAINKQMKSSQNISFRRILTEIWIKFIQIYSKLSFYNDKVKEMINILKLIIRDNIIILLRNDIMQDLNELYDLIRQDFIEDNLGCQLLLLNCIQCGEMSSQDELQFEDQQLFKNYLFRLFHNNWRAKQLTNRGFQYSPHFYDMLHKLNNGRPQNPYYLKLLSLETKK